MSASETTTTIRMTEIPSVWPPEPGPDQRTTGLKTVPGQVFGTFCETLYGLHEGAWWTGFQLKCPDQPETEFYIRLMSDIGVDQPFGVSTAWFQKAGDWHALPWAIPARLATVMRLYLEITPIGHTAPEPIWIARRLGFHELGEAVSPDGRYLFVQTDGHVCATWDERLSAWATRNRGHVPFWGFPYYVVPPLRDYLMVSSQWKDGRKHNLLHWDEFVAMP